MSVEISDRVWKHSQKDGAPFVVIAGDGGLVNWGYCHPSIEQMAISAGTTERNILIDLEPVKCAV